MRVPSDADEVSTRVVRQISFSTLPGEETPLSMEMPDTMARDAVDYAIKAMQEFKTENDIANAIKKYMDQHYTPTWNVMCGRSFGAYVTHETKRYIYFSIGHLSILCWKCG